MFCYEVNYIVCHYETFNVALKLAFGEVISKTDSASKLRARRREGEIPKYTAYHAYHPKFRASCEINKS